MPKLDYESINDIKSKNPAWRLLLADMAPLIISFLNRVFVEPNIRTISEQDLIDKLEDDLYFLRDMYGEGVFRRSPSEYLKEWSEPEKGWLRCFYPVNSDEPHFDMTPASEKVIAWVHSLTQNTFVGTESRLKTIFDLLHQMVEGTEVDPEVRIAELKKRRDEIDAEIMKIENGEILLLDDTAIKDRFQQFSAMARELLSDFREVEYNFRMLDRSVRERIALWSSSKGELLDEIFGEHDAITESDQGRSFRAFTEFLLSQSRQQELNDLLGKVMQMPSVLSTKPDEKLGRISDSWLNASYHTMSTMRLLSSQLRHFLDSKVWLENRRIVDILKNIEAHSLKIRDDQPIGNFMELNGTGVDIKLIMERPLFTPSTKNRINSEEVLHGEDDADASSLFEQFYIDKNQLKGRIEKALRRSSQITLKELLDVYPPHGGLAEVVAYMSIASERDSSIFDESETEEIIWLNETGSHTRAKFPRIIFLKEAVK
ncbi:MAG: DUF3375 domain-containing protein [Synergistaceae bacterium]|nr:DUF3375 domain-containing protein [Synergistaceae bacterium]